MIQQFLALFEGLGVSVLDAAAIVWLVEHCIFKPVMWLWHRHKGD